MEDKTNRNQDIVYNSNVNDSALEEGEIVDCPELNIIKRLNYRNFQNYDFNKMSNLTHENDQKYFRSNIGNKIANSLEKKKKYEYDKKENFNDSVIENQFLSNEDLIESSDKFKNTLKENIEKVENEKDNPSKEENKSISNENLQIIINSSNITSCIEDNKDDSMKNKIYINDDSENKIIVVDSDSKFNEIKDSASNHQPDNDYKSIQIEIQSCSNPIETDNENHIIYNAPIIIGQKLRENKEILCSKNFLTNNGIQENSNKEKNKNTNNFIKIQMKDDPKYGKTINDDNSSPDKVNKQYKDYFINNINKSDKNIINDLIPKNYQIHSHLNSVNQKLDKNKPTKVIKSQNKDDIPIQNQIGENFKNKNKFKEKKISSKNCIYCKVDISINSSILKFKSSDDFLTYCKLFFEKLTSPKREAYSQSIMFFDKYYNENYKISEHVNNFVFKSIKSICRSCYEENIKEIDGFKKIMSALNFTILANNSTQNDSAHALEFPRELNDSKNKNNILSSSKNQKVKNNQITNLNSNDNGDKKISSINKILEKDFNNIISDSNITYNYNKKLQCKDSQNLTPKNIFKDYSDLEIFEDGNLRFQNDQNMKDQDDITKSPIKNNLEKQIDDMVILNNELGDQESNNNASKQLKLELLGKKQNRKKNELIILKQRKTKASIDKKMKINMSQEEFLSLNKNLIASANYEKSYNNINQISNDTYVIKDNDFKNNHKLNVPFQDNIKNNICSTKNTINSNLNVKTKNISLENLTVTNIYMNFEDNKTLNPKNSLQNTFKKEENTRNNLNSPIMQPENMSDNKKILGTDSLNISCTHENFKLSKTNNEEKNKNIPHHLNQENFVKITNSIKEQDYNFKQFTNLNQVCFDNNLSSNKFKQEEINTNININDKSNILNAGRDSGETITGQTVNQKINLISEDLNSNSKTDIMAKEALLNQSQSYEVREINLHEVKNDPFHEEKLNLSNLRDFNLILKNKYIYKHEKDNSLIRKKDTGHHLNKNLSQTKENRDMISDNVVPKVEGELTKTNVASDSKFLSESMNDKCTQQLLKFQNLNKNDNNNDNNHNNYEAKIFMKKQNVSDINTNINHAHDLEQSENDQELLKHQNISKYQNSYLSKNIPNQSHNNVNEHANNLRIPNTPDDSLNILNHIFNRNQNINSQPENPVNNFINLKNAQEEILLNNANAYNKYIQSMLNNQNINNLALKGITHTDIPSIIQYGNPFGFTQINYSNPLSNNMTPISLNVNNHYPLDKNMFGIDNNLSLSNALNIHNMNPNKIVNLNPGIPSILSYLNNPNNNMIYKNLPNPLLNFQQQDISLGTTSLFPAMQNVGNLSENLRHNSQNISQAMSMANPRARCDYNLIRLANFNNPVLQVTVPVSYEIPLGVNSNPQMGIQYSLPSQIPLQYMNMNPLYMNTPLNGLGFLNKLNSNSTMSHLPMSSINQSNKNTKYFSNKFFFQILYVIGSSSKINPESPLMTNFNISDQNILNPIKSFMPQVK